jgi:hypothetical protein
MNRSACVVVIIAVLAVVAISNSTETMRIFTAVQDRVFGSILGSFESYEATRARRMHEESAAKLLLEIKELERAEQAAQEKIEHQSGL